MPPDVNGDIGLDDDGNRIYIQYINLIWGVFDVTGNLTDGPFAGNTFWAGFGNQRPAGALSPLRLRGDARRRQRLPENGRLA